MEAVLEALRDIENHENEQCPPMNVEGECKRASKMRKMVAKSTQWIKKAAARVHKELRRRE